MKLTKSLATLLLTAAAKPTKVVLNYEIDGSGALHSASTPKHHAVANPVIKIIIEEVEETHQTQHYSIENLGKPQAKEHVGNKLVKIFENAHKFIENTTKPAHKAEPAHKDLKPAQKVDNAVKPAKPVEPAHKTAEAVKPAEPAHKTVEAAKPAEPAHKTIEAAKPANKTVEAVKPAEHVDNVVKSAEPAHKTVNAK